jgi:hypothetical protein
MTDSAPAAAAALTPGEEQAMVQALARSTVTEVAPEELPLFEPTSEAYFDPSRREDGRTPDEMLGFGVDAAAAAVLVTPVALEAARSVISYLVGELSSALKDEAGPRIREIVKRVLGGDDDAKQQKPDGPDQTGEPEPRTTTDPKPTPPTPATTPLTPAQLDELHKVALRTAERMGMERAKASVVADAIVGAIVR